MKQKQIKPKYKCQYCDHKIAYVFIAGKKIAVEASEEPEIIKWKEHTCDITIR